MADEKNKEEFSVKILWDIYKIPVILGGTSLVMIVSAGILLFKSAQSSSPIKITDAGEVAGEATGSAFQNEIFVDIEGAVIKPGVYKMPGGSRVADIIEKAGGLSADADVSLISKSLNKAARLMDGAKLYLPEKGDEIGPKSITTHNNGFATYSESTSQNQAQNLLQTGSSQNEAGSFISINNATQSELESLNGVGPVTAKKIIDGRPYGSIEDLLSRKIVGQSVFGKIKSSISL